MSHFNFLENQNICLVLGDVNNNQSIRKKAATRKGKKKKKWLNKIIVDRKQFVFTLKIRNSRRCNKSTPDERV